MPLRRTIQPSSASVRSASPTIAIAAEQQPDADRPGERGLAELAPLVARPRAAALRRAPRRRPAGEAVREALVGPADHAVAERDGEADVGGGEPVLEAGGRAVREVDDGRDEQDEVDERDGGEQHRAEPAAAEQVARDEPGSQHDPEADLAGDDDGDQHASFLAHLC